MRIRKSLLIWAVFLFLGSIISIFLHECAHGLGSHIEGIHVSTGFNRIGDAGKRPSDPDFRENLSFQRGKIVGDLSGPILNWMLAIFFTVLLYLKTNSDWLALVYGATSLSNSLARLIPMGNFFLGASMGNLVVEDEVSAGILTIEDLKFPLSFSELRALTETRPEFFLSQPKIYILPVLSFSLAVTCLIFTYSRLCRLYRKEFSSLFSRMLFALMPILVGPLVLVLTHWLDNIIRINW